MTEEENLVIEYEKCSQELEHAEQMVFLAQKKVKALLERQNSMKRKLSNSLYERALVYKGNIYFVEAACDGIKVLPLVNNVK